MGQILGDWLMAEDCGNDVVSLKRHRWDALKRRPYPLLRIPTAQAQQHPRVTLFYQGVEQSAARAVHDQPAAFTAKAAPEHLVAIHGDHLVLVGRDAPH